MHHRSSIDTRDRSSAISASKALWHDKLNALDTKFNLENFILQAVEIDDKHKNADIINRALDILDVMRDDESILSEPSERGHSSRSRRNHMSPRKSIRVERSTTRRGASASDDSRSKAFRARLQESL